MKKGLLLIVSLIFSGCSVLYEKDSRNANKVWQDRQIAIQIAGIVNKAPYKGNLRVNASSLDGELLLIGQAKDRQMKSQLIDEIRNIKGIKYIYDQIRIKPPLSLSAVSKDTWLTTKVKSALIGSKKLRDVSITVLTEDSEVFLLGYVTQTQAKEATEITRNLTGVKQVIQGFQLVK